MASDVTIELTLERAYRELVTLRSRRGITQRRVEQQVTLCALPIVDSEMARVGLQDRSAAAYNVVECAVLRGIGRPDLRLILRRTLNLSGTDGEGLDDRREVVRAELHLFGNAYEDRESIAYRELASFLLRRQSSPCGADVGDRPSLLIEGDESEHDPELTFTESALRTLLRAVVHEVIEERRAELARDALDLLAGAKPFLRSQESAAQSLLRVVQAATRYLLSSNDPPLTQLPTAHVVTPAVTIELGARQLIDLFRPELEPDAPIARHWSNRVPDQALWAPAYFRWKHEVLDWVAFGVTAIEQRAQWATVFGSRESSPTT